MYKRFGFKRVCIFILIFVFGVQFALCGCSKAVSPYSTYVDGRLSVTFISGRGECIFIVLPNGKTMLIDSGVNTIESYENLTYCLGSNTSIDYFILTNPDFDHIGNAVKIINDYTVKSAYIPYLVNEQVFSEYANVKKELKGNHIPITYSCALTSFSTQEYTMAMLSPNSVELGGYREINLAESPTNSMIDEISAVLYLEYKGVRFLFASDINSNIEQTLVNNYRSGFYNTAIGQGVINISFVDFIKLSHHGNAGASCTEFLELTYPKNAIITIGGDSSKYPASSVLTRLVKINPNVNIARTDFNGNITVCVHANGSVQMVTES